MSKKEKIYEEEEVEENMEEIVGKKVCINYNDPDSYYEDSLQRWKESLCGYDAEPLSELISFISFILIVVLPIVFIGFMVFKSLF